MKQRTEKSGSRGKRAGIIVAAVLLWLLLMASLALLMDARGVRFYVYGDDEITLEYGTPYVEPGVYAVTAGRLFGESEKHLPIETDGAVDTGHLGSYVLRYTTRFAFSEYSTERRVTIVDTTAPVIELKHIEGYEPTWMTGYAEEGYTAYDACDGDLTGHVLREKTEDGVRYTVTDSSGNTTSVERILPKINYQPPTITLLGGEEISVPASLWFSDPGYTAEDILGKKRTKEIKNARNIAMYVIRKLTPLSLPKIGSIFERDYSTVHSNLQTVDKQITIDPLFESEINDIIREMKRN